MLLTLSYGSVSSLRKQMIPVYLITIVKVYFCNRSLLVEINNGLKEYNVTTGVSQVSFLGPLLWNIMYNGIFELDIPEEACIVGFADDISVLVKAWFLDVVESIRTIKSWLTSGNLQLAQHKAEVILINGKRRRETMKLQIGNTIIESSKAIKYLGIMLDDRLNFKSHVLYALQKQPPFQTHWQGWCLT